MIIDPLRSCCLGGEWRRPLIAALSVIVSQFLVQLKSIWALVSLTNDPNLKGLGLSVFASRAVLAMPLVPQSTPRG